MFTLTCRVCNSSFSHTQPNTRTCSNACRYKRTQQLTGRHVHSQIHIPSATIGAMSELFIAADLMKHGYSVFRALSPACFCDLIATKQNQTIYLEARTGYKSTQGNLNFPKNIRGNATHFGVYERNSGEIHYLNLNLTPFVP